MGPEPSTTGLPRAADEELARHLEGTEDYRILRRLKPRAAAPAGAPSDRIGVIVDLETTGLDASRDEIIEIGAVRFAYTSADEVAAITGVFQSFNEPSGAIPGHITQLTGIDDAMVRGHRIDEDALVRFVESANVVIAHNAGFDRKFAERAWPVFRHKPWACSATEIDWRAHGFGGAKLSYLLTDAGFFHNAHRAVDDCHAILELLARPLPDICAPALRVLLARARRRTIRIWAEHSPFEFKAILKSRGYRWNDGADGSPRCWFVDIDGDRCDDELRFLKREIYGCDAEIRTQSMTAWERFSPRM